MVCTRWHSCSSRASVRWVAHRHYWLAIGFFAGCPTFFYRYRHRDGSHSAINVQKRRAAGFCRSRFYFYSSRFDYLQPDTRSCSWPFPSDGDRDAFNRSTGTGCIYRDREPNFASYGAFIHVPNSILRRAISLTFVVYTALGVAFFSLLYSFRWELAIRPCRLEPLCCLSRHLCWYYLPQAGQYAHDHGPRCTVNIGATFDCNRPRSYGPYFTGPVVLDKYPASSCRIRTGARHDSGPCHLHCTQCCFTRQGRGCIGHKQCRFPGSPADCCSCFSSDSWSFG